MTVSNQTYNVARGLVRATSTGGGARRIIFTSIANDSTVNRFVPGSGVGALNRSVKNYLYTHATPNRVTQNRSLTGNNGASQCNCCDTSGQAILKTAKAMVFTCMDFRLRNNTTCNLTCKGYYNNYDEVIAAGVSLGYNGLLDFTAWNTYIDTHITLGHMLHNINEIIIVEHAQCGAYAAQYGSPVIPTPPGKYPVSGGYLLISDEIALQTQNVNLCGSVLWSKFNGTNGTVRPITGLVIIGYIASIDGCGLQEIYRRNS
jgi:hypothetical protein